MTAENPHQQPRAHCNCRHKRIAPITRARETPVAATATVMTYYSKEMLRPVATTQLQVDPLLVLYHTTTNTRGSQQQPTVGCLPGNTICLGSTHPGVISLRRDGWVWARLRHIRCWDHLWGSRAHCGVGHAWRGPALLPHSSPWVPSIWIVPP